MKKSCSLWYLFLVFFLIGAFTWGGGYAMLPLIKRELVGAGFLEEEEFVEVVSLAQSLPGAVAINTASLVGWRLRGWRGELVAIAGTSLPSFLSIVVISFFLFSRALFLSWPPSFCLQCGIWAEKSLPN